MKMLKLGLMAAAALVGIGGSFAFNAPRTTFDPNYKAVYSGSNFTWVSTASAPGTPGNCLTAPGKYCTATFASTPVANQVPTGQISTGTHI